MKRLDDLEALRAKALGTLTPHEWVQALKLDGLFDEDPVLIVAATLALPALLRVCRAAAAYREAEKTIDHSPHLPMLCRGCATLDKARAELDSALADLEGKKEEETNVPD